MQVKVTISTLNEIMIPRELITHPVGQGHGCGCLKHLFRHLVPCVLYNTSVWLRQIQTLD